MAPRTPEQHLIALRSQTQSWGQIDEAQVLQLKYWIRAAAQGSTAATVAVDVEGWSVKGTVTVPAGHQADELRLEGLGRSVAWLLGEGFDLTICDVAPGGWRWHQPGDPAKRQPHRQRREAS